MVIRALSGDSSVEAGQILHPEGEGRKLCIESIGQVCHDDPYRLMKPGALFQIT